MATNPTKDPEQFLLKLLREAECAKAKAHHRVKVAQEKQKEKKKQFELKGKEYKRPDIPDTNSEIIHLGIKINNLNYCLEAVREKKEREEGKIIKISPGKTSLSNKKGD